MPHLYKLCGTFAVAKADTLVRGVRNQSVSRFGPGDEVAKLYNNFATSIDNIAKCNYNYI